MNSQEHVSFAIARDEYCDEWLEVGSLSPEQFAELAGQANTSAVNFTAVNGTRYIVHKRRRRPPAEELRARRAQFVAFIAVPSSFVVLMLCGCVCVRSMKGRKTRKLIELTPTIESTPNHQGRAGSA